VTYRVSGPCIYASVLDMGRLWERLLRRAQVPLAYSYGFSPHPRLNFGPPLPVGYSSEGEWLDVWLTAVRDPLAVQQALLPQQPAGVEVVRVAEVDIKAPTPQALVRAARYEVVLWSETPPVAVQAALQGLLESATLPRQRHRKGEMISYDLRPLIMTLAHEGERSAAEGGGQRLAMVLRCGPSGSGRPEEVLAALGVPLAHYTIRRTRFLESDTEEAVA
jgi:radical SAM-linked protein